jgi:hypothetical protein
LGGHWLLMEIKNDTRTIKGEHGGVGFTLRDGGQLEVFGVQWSRAKIRALVELASLLEHSGFKIAEKEPKAATTYDSMCGLMMRHTLFGVDPIKPDEPETDKDEPESNK